jgi:hypothetical protein
VAPRDYPDFAAIGEAEAIAFLSANSGLPGPRGNLELADAFAAAAPSETILRLAGESDEYLRFCGTQGLGRLAVERPDGDSLIATLIERAQDPLWRVREGAARALQIVGDRVPARLAAIVREWMGHDDPYVRRAALAAICEPRLIRSPAGFQVGLDACRDATASLLALGGPTRTSPSARNLRQALGYCWSVVVAANPPAGLPVFARLRESEDPDVQWIVAENLKKNRLKRLLG